MSKHIEIHTLNSAHESLLAIGAGLPDTSETRDCANCETPIASEDYYVPRVLILDEDHYWVLCQGCTEPVLEPRNKKLRYTD